MPQSQSNAQRTNQSQLSRKFIKVVTENVHHHRNSRTDSLLAAQQPVCRKFHKNEPDCMELMQIPHVVSRDKLRSSHLGLLQPV